MFQTTNQNFNNGSSWMPLIVTSPTPQHVQHVQRVAPPLRHAPPAALTVDGRTVHFEVGVALRVVGILGSASGGKKGQDTVEIDQKNM